MYYTNYLTVFDLSVSKQLNVKSARRMINAINGDNIQTVNDEKDT